MTVQPARAEVERLAREHGALVFKAAYRVLGDAALAEDVQQDVFLRLLQAPHTAAECWPAYLSTAAVRMAIDVLRRRQRWWQVLPQWKAQAATQAPSAEQAGIATERAQRLRAAIARLPRREAQCFGMRYLQGLEIAEIAQALELGVNNVSVSLHRARNRLQVLIEPADPEEA